MSVNPNQKKPALWLSFFYFFCGKYTVFCFLFLFTFLLSVTVVNPWVCSCFSTALKTATGFMFCRISCMCSSSSRGECLLRFHCSPTCFEWSSCLMDEWAMGRVVGMCYSMCEEKVFVATVCASVRNVSLLTKCIITCTSKQALALKNDVCCGCHHDRLQRRLRPSNNTFVQNSAPTCKLRLT